MELIRTYSELIKLPTFEERFEYLKLDGIVGQETFGFDRYLNQKFYQDKAWKAVRDYCIVRDEGRDLAMFGYDIGSRITVHHMNTITLEDLAKKSTAVLDPEFLICVSSKTHKAIHYGDASLLPSIGVERAPNDTCPWRK